MPDEFDKPIEESQSDDGGEDAEVPLLPPLHHHKTPPSLAPQPFVIEQVVLEPKGEPVAVGNLDVPLPANELEPNVIERTTIRYARYGFIVAVLTLLAMVGTAIVFWDQFKEMSSQTDLLAISARQARRDSAESSIASSKQLAIAQEQSKAAQDQVDAIGQQMRVDQRAWVQVAAISEISGPKAGSLEEYVLPTFGKHGLVEIPYTFTVKNTGKTPAKQLRIGSSDSFGPEPHKPPDANNPLVPGILFADQFSDRYPRTPISLSSDQWQQWIAGKSFVFVYVDIEYRDIFAGSKVHHTWMCSKFEFFGKQTFCHIDNDGN